MQGARETETLTENKVKGMERDKEPSDTETVIEKDTRKKDQKH